MTKAVFLCGDSHASILALYAKKAGIDFLGGPIGNGIVLEQDFFVIEPDSRLILTHADLKSRQALFEQLPTYDGPILSTVGFNSHRAANALWTYLQDNNSDIEEISRAVLTATVKSMRTGSLKFYEQLCKCSNNVYFTTSPQLCLIPEQLPVLQAFESVMVQEITQLGGKLIDVRPDITDAGVIKDEFIRKEGKRFVHGNDKWAQLIFDRLAQAAS